METDPLLECLNEAQREAVTTSAAPLCILAGAGAGKTRVLTRRIAYRALTGDADPRHTLALTFTRTSSAELSARLGRLGLRDRPTAGTFHAVALGQLRTRWADLGRRAPTLLDRKGRLLRPLLAGAGGSRRLTVGELAAEIEWAKARMIDPAGYVEAAERADRRPPCDVGAIAARYQRYEDAKRAAEVVDFDDVLADCCRVLETDPNFAAAQRWRFRHLFVDEFQDVNPLQHRLLEAWRGSGTDMCVVGDPDQAIYAWNGADASFLAHFPRQFPTATVVDLVDNYRSSPQILAVANRIIDHGTSRPRRLRSNRPPGPFPSVESHPTDRDEATAVARALRDHHQPGRPWSDQAVLVRTNAQTVLLEAALRQARIPYRVRGATAFLDHPAVREELGRLRHDHRPFATTLVDLEDVLAELAGRQADGDGEAADSGGPSRAERHGVYETLVRLAREFAVVDPDPTPSGFCAWLYATVRTESPASGDAVDVGTFHAANCLEWPVGHLAGLEHVLVPIAYARTADALAEERRLFYVAVTRAERTLRCTWARRRTFGARDLERRP
ncbi:ATP-dependent DNA helicase UvrD2 [soil metagenome]